MDVMKVDLAGAEVIGFASSEGDGADRWTEIRVYYQPDGWPRFCAETIGRSRIPGEVSRTRRMPGGTLERALKLVDEGTSLGLLAANEARDWRERNLAPDIRAGQRFEGKTVTEALCWLFPNRIDERTGLPRLTDVAAYLGVSRRSIERAIAAEEEGEQASLTVPLLDIIPLIDRRRLPADAG